jgi:hypothetical protein
MIVSNALVKVGHCQVNYNHPPRTKKLDGGFAFAQCKSTGLLNSAFDQSLLTDGHSKKQAGSEGAIVNSVVLRLIEQGLGKSRKKSGKQYDDLANLAGTWSQQDALEFDQAVAGFGGVDPQIWATSETQSSSKS